MKARNLVGYPLQDDRSVPPCIGDFPHLARRRPGEGLPEVLSASVIVAAKTIRCIAPAGC